jgi:uncharacterized protein YdeI (YjbR/CyaY-like superfamily)
MDADKFARIEVKSDAELWAWLDANHAQTESVWLVTWRAQHKDRYVSREMVLDALIAHGWIDGRRMVLDGDRTMQLISPRRQHIWAQTYKLRAERLEAEGRMRPAGRAAVLHARQSGLWAVSDPIDALLEPEDLTAILKSHGGLAWWQASAPSYRRNILRWIALAKRPATRATRLETVAAHAAQGKKVPQY